MTSSHWRLGVGAFLFTLSFVAMAENAVTTEPASVRAGPDSSYPEVAQLDADTPIQVMGCLDDWSWCDVGFDGSRGWLYSPDITYQYEGGYVPFYTYAPGLGVPVISFTVDAYWGSYYHDRPWYRQRDEWVHRPIHHQRPPGPAPRSGPPPREAVRMDRPHGGPPADRSNHLGNAEPSRRDAERRDGAAGHVDPRAGDRPGDRADPRAAEGRGAEAHGSAAPRPTDRPSLPQHTGPGEHDSHAESPRGTPQHEEPPHVAAPPRAEPHAAAPPHAEPPHAAAPPHAEPPHAATPQHTQPQHAEPQHREAPHPQADRPEGPPHKS